MRNLLLSTRILRGNISIRYSLLPAVHDVQFPLHFNFRIFVKLYSSGFLFIGAEKNFDFRDIFFQLHVLPLVTENLHSINFLLAMLKRK